MHASRAACTTMKSHLKREPLSLSSHVAFISTVYMLMAHEPYASPNSVELQPELCPGADILIH